MCACWVYGSEDSDAPAWEYLGSECARQRWYELHHRSKFRFAWDTQRLFSTCGKAQAIYIAEDSYGVRCLSSEHMQAAEPLPPAVIRQVAKELKDLQEKPEEGIKVRKAKLV